MHSGGDHGGIFGVIEEYGQHEDASISPGTDWVKECVCLRGTYYLRSFLVIVNILVSAIVAWILCDELQGYVYNDLELLGRWISAGVGGLMFLVSLHTYCSGKGLRGPFERSTCELLVFNPHHHRADHLNTFYSGIVYVSHSWTGTHRNQLRVPLFLVHMGVCGAVFAIYYGAIDVTSRVRNVVYIVILCTPTLTGLIDFAKVRRVYSGLATVTRHPPGRLYWSTLSLLLKAVIYACTVLVVDPAAVVAESVVWIVTVLLGYLVISFWVAYHNCHAGEREKPFAYTEFPATVCLVMSYAYLLNQRFQREADTVDTFHVAHDYVLMMSFVTTQAIGILNIPPELDFSDVLFNDATVHPQQSKRLTEAGGNTEFTIEI